MIEKKFSPSNIIKSKDKDIDVSVAFVIGSTDTHYTIRVLDINHKYPTTPNIGSLSELSIRFAESHYEKENI